MSELTHLDEHGAARMVDVSGKTDTAREARAEAYIRMQPETLARILDGTHPKGDVLAVARVAGIMAAKKTHELIPLCHALNLSGVSISMEPQTARCGIRIEVCCRLTGATGVEMEALTAATVTALTLYDMCKAVDKGMLIEQVRLLEKRGGRSGHWQAEPSP